MAKLRSLFTNYQLCGKPKVIARGFYGGEKWNIVHLAPTETPTLEEVTQFFSRFYSAEIAAQILIYLICLLTAWLVLAVIFKILIIILQTRRSSVIIEITPPQDTKIASVSTTQLFNHIFDLLSRKSIIDRLLLKQMDCSFEIVSRKNTGIRYFVQLPRGIAGTFIKNLRSYAPGIQVNEISDYLPKNVRSKRYRISEYKMAQHFYLPIQEQQDLKQHDPLAYLTGNMTELKEGDILAVQIVVKPLNGFEDIGIRRAIAKIKSSIRNNKFALVKSMAGLELFATILEGIAQIAILPLLAVSDLVTGNNSRLPERAPSKPQINLALKEIEESVKIKLSEPLSGISIRTLLILNDNLNEREKGLESSFSSYRHSDGQSIVKSKNLLSLWKKIGYWLFCHRITGTKIVFSPSEVAALYHFPFVTNPEHSDLVRNKSRKLPAPLSLRKTDSNLDVIVGVNKFGNETVPIGLTLEQRQKHMYLIGKTGMGKTTLLKNAIYQDMVSGKGLAVLDPHGDLLQELLGIIPKNRRNDVIVFDPSDREWPIGLNILAPGIKFSDKEDEQEWITSSVLGVFAKITAKEYWGPRMEHILRNAVMTALQTKNPSIYTLQKLLTDKSYQKKIALTLKDPVLRQFWNKEFSLLGKMQLSSVTAPLTQRLGSFITTKMSRHILLQEKSTISVSNIMDEGKILLVNLSKGDLGEDMSFFFGLLVTSLIWMSAYQRTKIPEKERRDFFLYVDEFQNFATPRFSEITSEGRKYHVSLIASHQNLAQVEDKDIIKVVAGNANTIICLKASPDDEKFILPFMDPEIEKGDIVNLPPYHFFMKVTNENSENAFSGQTVPLEIESSDQVRMKVIENSRKQNATSRADVEEYLSKLFTGRAKERQKEKPTVKTKRTGKKVTKKLGNEKKDFTLEG